MRNNLHMPHEPSKTHDPWLVPTSFRILEAQEASDFELLEAASAADNSAQQLRKFTMTAYTGGKLLLAGYAYPVVVDLSGLRVSAKSRPILRDHDASRIVGHTDNQGKLDYNTGLSQRRAEAVVKALSTVHGIPASRMTARGLASLAPVATNRSDEGRAKNRRVELVEQ